MIDKAFADASFRTSLTLITLLRLSPILPFAWVSRTLQMWWESRMTCVVRLLSAKCPLDYVTFSLINASRLQANYIFGLSPVPWTAFTVGTFVGCFPAITGCAATSHCTKLHRSPGTCEGDLYVFALRSRLFPIRAGTFLPDNWELKLLSMEPKPTHWYDKLP